MKRIYFKEYVKLNIISKKCKYKILEMDGNKYIVGGYTVFKIIGKHKTQFKQLIIEKGNGIDFLNYLLYRNEKIRFLIEVDKEKYLCSNLLSPEGFEKDAFDIYEDSYNDFKDLTDRMKKYDCYYPAISGEKYVL